MPTVIEFESEGSIRHVTEQARRICRGMGRAESLCQDDLMYEPILMEIKRTGGAASPDELNVVIHPATA